MATQRQHQMRGNQRSRTRPSFEDPFSAMRQMFEEMERAFDIDSPMDDESEDADEELAPRMEIVQRGKKLVVRVDLPGVPCELIDVSVDDGALVIEAERPLATDDDNTWSSECTHGRFRRVVALPDGIDTSKIDARFENGVLELTLEAPAALRARRIEIKNRNSAQRLLPEGSKPRSLED